MTGSREMCGQNLLQISLTDGQCWQPVKALLLPSPGPSVRWSSGSAHMTTDEKHMENLASLSEVESSRPKLSTAAEAAMSRRGMGVVSCLGSSELAHRQDYEAKKCTDITVPVRERDTQVVSSCKAQEEIYMDQEAVPATMNKSGLQIEAEKLSQDTQTPSTVVVWIDGAWSGEPVSCKPPLAGAGRRKNHAIESEPRRRK